jgi:phage/plasmid-like protein (TIGR03299 family)
MSHELETHGDDVAFVDTRSDAWHRLNQLPLELRGTPLTAAQFMEHSHLANWDVHVTPAYVNIGTGHRPKFRTIPGKNGIVRTNPFTGELEVLGGSVGKIWTPFQNEDLVDFLDTLVDQSEGALETGGSLRGGREVFVTTKLPQTMTIGGVDKLDLYIAALNAHDGTRGIRFIATEVRVVCANTQRAAVDTALESTTIRHTAKAAASVEKVRQSLDLAFAGFTELEAEFERMVQTQQTDAEFQAMVDATFHPGGVPEDDGRGLTMKKNRDAKLHHLFADAATQANVRGTRYAGYQAVLEYLDHFAPVQGKGKPDADRRAERFLAGQASEVSRRNRLFSVARVPA